MSDLLQEARKIINEADRAMAELFEKRMRAAEMVAQYKMEHALEILDAKREAEVIKRNSEYITDDELRSYYVRFIEATMSVSRSYQARLMEGMRVAYAGTEGAFAHLASMKLFPTAKKISYGDFEAAYRAVENGECDAAVLPIENSYNGEVGQVTDLIYSGTLFINGMTELQITQDLLGVSDARIEDIKEVISHPQALGQCREYILEHGFATREYDNTALAAKFVSEKGDPAVAAIASAEAADIFGLRVLEKNINSSATNTTRFVILSRSENTATEGNPRTTTVLLFTVNNEAGALAKAIEIIGRHGFNMRCIRSRPMKELMWQYYFYVEAEGDLSSAEGRAMLDELGSYCDKLKAAGRFIKN